MRTSEKKGPNSKPSHGRILISWNPILYTFLCTKIKKITIDNIFSRDACSESMYGLNHPIIEYPKNEKSDDGQTDRQNFLSKNVKKSVKKEGFFP